jgi:hypothetical protein
MTKTRYLRLTRAGRSGRIESTRKTLGNAHIAPMPNREREREWEVIRLRARGEPVGKVTAKDREAALKIAIGRFNIRPSDQQRLIILPR